MCTSLTYSLKNVRKILVWGHINCIPVKYAFPCLFNFNFSVLFIFDASKYQNCVKVIERTGPFSRSFSVKCLFKTLIHSSVQVIYFLAPIKWRNNDEFPDFVQKYLVCFMKKWSKSNAGTDAKHRINLFWPKLYFRFLFAFDKFSALHIYIFY